MTTQKFISNENEIRIKLVNDPKFLELCIKCLKQMGIPAQEWNENKMSIALYFANEFIAKDNKENGLLREFLENN